MMKKIVGAEALKRKQDDDEWRLFDLDKNRLDEEWVAQPKLYFKAAMELADAKEDLERAKADLDLTDAELFQEISAQPDRFGLEKATVDAVKNAIVREDRHQKAVNKVIRLRHEVDVRSVAVDTLDHRKKGLESLVHLRLAQYYAEPRPPEGAEPALASFKRNKR